jgi:preprotein translocase subunit SecG
MLKKPTKILFFILILLLILLACITKINAEHPQIQSNVSSGDSRNNLQSDNDTDSDGLSDDLDDDDDNDGMPDSWEETWSVYAEENNLDYRFDTKNAIDAYEDWDGDGYSNVNEYLSNTNPFNNKDYPQTIHKTPRYDDDWERFLAFLILAIFLMMIISIIIGVFVIRKRRQDELFWTSVFGGNENNIKLDNSGPNIFRDKYLEWQRRIDPKKDKKDKKEKHMHKYKLEVIGGSDTDLKIRHRITEKSISGPGKKGDYKYDPRFKGRFCLWCDSAITKKYLKRCPEMRTLKRRCPDGPFCSKRCLNEHLNVVPHYKEVDF